MKHFILIALAAIFLQGCKDIIAENISGKTPQIILPYNGQTVMQNPVHFKWEPIEGATKYRLQVASPSFSNIQIYALDSIVTGTDFYMALDSNSYELKLTAMNAGYTSHTLDKVFFTVGVQPSGGGNAVVLQTPADSAFFKSAAAFEKTFTWTQLSGASYYEFYLKKGASFANGQQLDYDAHVNPPTKTIAETIVLGEGQYHWAVRAYLTSGSETALARRKFFIDTTKPNVPVLVSPNLSQTPGDIVFTWTTPGTDPGAVHAPIHAVIEVAENQTFTVGLVTREATGNTATINLIGIGDRFWRVKNVDAAGNISIYSNIMAFSIQ